MNMPITDELSIDFSILENLMPMYVLLDMDWKIKRVGRTLIKLGLTIGDETPYFLDVFEILHPRKFIQDIDALAACGWQFKGYFKSSNAGKLKGYAQVLTHQQGILINFSMGAGMVNTVGAEGLGAEDFAPSDASVDLLYLIDVQQALLAEARRSTFKMHKDRRSALNRADTDALTSLANRRGLDAFIDRILSRKTFVPFAFIMIDLDFFKAVNDTYGHAAGDAVLRSVADRLNRLTRREDMVARTGGDEFNIILPNFDDLDSVKTLSHRIIQELKQDIEYDGKTCNIGASIGATVVAQKVDFNLTSETVDRALYTSKESGRGTVTIV